MDRRTFLKMSAVSPLGIHHLSMRIVRAQFTVAESVSAQMIVTAHATSEAADLWRKGWEYRAFEGEGEWYLQTSKRLVLPDHLAKLPGSLMDHSFVIGYAAEKRSMLVGTFRRGQIACVIRVLGNNREEMIALAEWFSTRPVPDPWELLWSGAQLQGFVPTTEHFGMTIKMDDIFWP